MKLVVSIFTESSLISLPTKISAISPSIKQCAAVRMVLLLITAPEQTALPTLT
jgi:hypothetical protein